ncbi:hypothetical protein Gotur_020163, partial [Gossypium turneri]
MVATRFEIEKFDGETNFNLWQVQMMTILVQTGLKNVVTGKKYENLNQTEWEELDEKTLDHISQFITLLNDLKNIEVLINDEDQTMLLLCSLPPSYKSFKETLIYGSIVTGEIGYPSSVTESKSTHLERRQLGHRRENGMTVSLKRVSLLDVGFEKLGHCVRENQTQVSFDLAVHKSKARVFQLVSTDSTQLIPCIVQD